MKIEWKVVPVSVVEVVVDPEDGSVRFWNRIHVADELLENDPEIAEKFIYEMAKRAYKRWAETE